MTKTLTAHFDGKVLIPDHPIDLPQNRRLVVSVEPADSGEEESAHGTVGYLVKHLTSQIPDEDAGLMRRAIEDADTTFEPSPDINLD